MAIEDIRESLRKRFKVNSLRDFDLQKIIIIDRTKEGTSLTIDYERREHLVANVDVVLTFSRAVPLSVAIETWNGFRTGSAIDSRLCHCSKGRSRTRASPGNTTSGWNFSVMPCSAM